MAEHLRAGKPQRVAGFNLRSRHGLKTGTDDLGRVGAKVDRKCNERGRHCIEADTQAGQAEEDDEELHEQGRVADHLDITGDQGPEPGSPIDARRGAQGTNRQPGDHGHRSEQQGDADAFRDVVPLYPDVAKVEGVFHRSCIQFAQGRAGAAQRSRSPADYSTSRVQVWRRSTAAHFAPGPEAAGSLVWITSRIASVKTCAPSTMSSSLVFSLQ